MTALVAAMAPLLVGTAADATQVTGGTFTTTNPGVDNVVDTSDKCLNGNELVNCNLYTGKDFVWLTGGPDAASLGNGTYFFAVLDPGGQANPNDGSLKNLSDGANGDYQTRTFTITDGAISYTGSHDFSDNKIRLAPYDDTSNQGGVYIMALCKLDDSNTYPVNADSCKYDAFKVRSGSGGGGGGGGNASNPTITKSATGAYDTKWTWGITKSVDKTLVKQAGGSLATFNYTASVTHDPGTNSGVTVTGTIKVVNPNFDDSLHIVPFTVSSVTDQLSPSDGTNCTVDTSGGLTLTSFNTLYPYSCTLTALPTVDLNNTATVTWAGGTLSDGEVVTAGLDSFIFSKIHFTQTKIDDSVDVTDVFNGGTGTTIGTVTQADSSPKLLTYSQDIPVPYGCHSYDNTATFTTNTTGATGSNSKTVTACGPTGALTIGFWQNKNGQSIITSGAHSTLNVCNSGTWLRNYAPFQDLSATATCAQVGMYVTNVIKAANASGAAMNAMLKAQMLATALDVYFSDPTLSGNKINAPVSIGTVSIDLTKICKMIDGTGGTATCGGVYQNASAAFGGATSKTVSQILTYAASQSNAGGLAAWYGQVKATQELAKNTFDAINNQVTFTP
ncbi:hypothetical protein [Pengzhenrongella sp.]|uniref:hypothetical protein n=1 Tax=Pengzhenrongella sp. TaxID=2888820 RepID=UPI002F923BC5